MDTATTLTDLYTFDSTTGTIDPADYAKVESNVISGICSALEVEDDVQMSTPMGRMVAWISEFFTGVLGLNVQNANQLLVDAAAGQQLDAMAQWFQLARHPQSYSVVEVTCYADSAGMNIGAGTTLSVRNENGDIFQHTAAEDITIAPFAGKTLTFEAVAPGPIGVTAGSVNIIDSPYAGWESCINSSDGTTGSDIETDESLRDRINESRTVAPGFLGAIKNGVEAVLDNGSCIAIENNSGKNLDVAGVNMEPHSILVCVDGLGDPQESYAADSKVVKVAKAIFDNKPCGTGYTLASQSKSFPAATASSYQYTVPVTDAFGTQYTVYFCKPIEAPVSVRVVVKKRNYTGADIESDVKTAISEWADAQNFKCGESIYSTDIIKAVEERVAGVIVIECTVSDAGTDKGTAYLDIDAIHKAKFSAADITAREFVR